MKLSRALVVPLAIVAAVLGLLTGTTTAGAATITYDHPTLARIDVHQSAAPATDPILPWEERKPSTLVLVEDLGAATTRTIRVVATNSAAALDEAASGQVTLLGRFRGGTEGFVGKPGYNVLDLPSKGTGRWYWSRNKAFIDDAIATGDEIRLVTNPFEPIYSGGNTFQREIRYLKDLGYGFKEVGDHWVAVPGR